jgi:urease subunit gamma/beta
VHLSPREIDKLIIHQAGFLAQKRLARGVRLNHPEAVALLATQLLELIRDGRSVAELQDLGRHMLGRRQVLPGVPDMVAEVQVEGTFPDGTKLVTVHHPIASADGDLTMALYGSFLPVPELERFGDTSEDLIPGAVDAAEGDIELNSGRRTISLQVTNMADRPVQVGSHYHFVEVNPYLRFDRRKAYGFRLDIPAGMAVRFEPGESKTVQLVHIAGNQVIRGGNGIATGRVSPEGAARSMERVLAGGFGHEEGP